jgi:hypothetical protein
MKALNIFGMKFGEVSGLPLMMFLLCIFKGYMDDVYEWSI